MAADRQHLPTSGCRRAPTPHRSRPTSPAFGSWRCAPRNRPPRAHPKGDVRGSQHRDAKGRRAERRVAPKIAKKSRSPFSSRGRGPAPRAVPCSSPTTPDATLRRAHSDLFRHVRGARVFEHGDGRRPSARAVPRVRWTRPSRPRTANTNRESVACWRAVFEHGVGPRPRRSEPLPSPIPHAQSAIRNPHAHPQSANPQTAETSDRRQPKSYRFNRSLSVVRLTPSSFASCVRLPSVRSSPRRMPSPAAAAAAASPPPAPE